MVRSKSIDLFRTTGEFTLSPSIECPFFSRNSKPTEREMATALVLLKARHKLSNSCVTDICHFLRLLKVPDAPKSYSHILRLFNDESSTKKESTMIHICTECSQPCMDLSHCDNTDCGQHQFFNQSPLQFLHMPILPQIRDILSRSQNLNLQRQEQPPVIVDHMEDICDGSAYHCILCEQLQTKFISLVMNIDGIQIAKSSNASLWIISLAINELERRERFKMKNIIIAGVSASKKKPSREQMYAILTPIVQELQQLEYGRYFDLSTSKQSLQPLRIFLLAACLDKPAQALVQNLGEPIGSYGCGRCEIRGRSTQSTSHRGVLQFF